MISYSNKTFLFWFELSYLQFGIRVEDHLRQMCDGSIVHHRLGQLRCVLADVTEGGGRDAFECHLGLLKTQHQQWQSARIHH